MGFLREIVRRRRDEKASEQSPISHTWFAPSLHAVAISRIDHGQFSHAPSPESLTELIDNERQSVCRVALSGSGEVVGYIVYLLQPAGVILCELAVAENWRRYGVATILFSHVRGKLDRRRDALVACRSERDSVGLAFLKSQRPDSCRLIRWRADLPGVQHATEQSDLVQFAWYAN